MFWLDVGRMMPPLMATAVSAAAFGCGSLSHKIHGVLSWSGGTASQTAHAKINLEELIGYPAQPG